MSFADATDVFGVRELYFFPHVLALLRSCFRPVPGLLFESAVREAIHRKLRDCLSKLARGGARAAKSENFYRITGQKQVRPVRI